jgi:hypothetical protein
MFENAKPVDQYYKEQAAKGIRYGDASMKLKQVDYIMAAYGDWNLYQDEDGNLWEEYFSIGD